MTMSSPPESSGDVDASVRLSDRLADLTDRHERRVTWGLYLLSGVLAWVFRFCQDDAFITFRYAQNLARGYGLVLNPGERVEGYTNFLWTVLMAIPEKLGWSTPLFSELLGVAIFVLTVAVVLRVFRGMLGSLHRAVFALLVLLANLSFVGYATGGLETILQTLLVTVIAWLLLPPLHSPSTLTRRRLAASAVAGVALLVRLDSAVLIAGWFLISLAHQFRGPGWWRRSGEPTDPEGAATGEPAERTPLTAGALLTGLVALSVPLLAIVTPWLAWKLDYYGSLLPNTFVAKSGTSRIQPLIFGVVYLLGFLGSYGAFLLVGRWRRHRHSLFAIPGVPEAATIVALWCLYIVYVGADFMEFRFLIPVLPFLALAAAHLIDEFRPGRRNVALLVTLGLFSFSHVVIEKVPIPVSNFRDLDHWPDDSPDSWVSMGKLLGKAFPGGVTAKGQPILAISPLGVIPYYAELPTIDMLGLADTWVARHGIAPQYYYPGHVRMSPLSYLERRNVSLLIGVPYSWSLKKVDPDRTEYRTGELLQILPVLDLNQLPESARVIEIPLANGKAWPIVYLTQNDKVDAQIASGNWKSYPLRHECKDGDVTVAIKLMGTATCSS